MPIPVMIPQTLAKSRKQRQQSLIRYERQLDLIARREVSQWLQELCKVARCVMEWLLLLGDESNT